MTIRLLSPDLVRNRCDEVSFWATVAFGVLFASAMILGVSEYSRIAATLAAMAGSCAGVSIGAQLVGGRLK